MSNENCGGRWLGTSPGAFLHSEQRYVLSAAERLGLRLLFVRHRLPTVTCVAKARLLGWPLDRIVRSLYFDDGQRLVGVVLPAMMERIDTVKLFRDVLGLTRKSAKRFEMRRCPTGMTRGSCTPFIRTSSRVASPPVERIIFHESGSDEWERVDVSLGGTSPSAYRRSCQLSYQGIALILEDALAGLLVRRNLTSFLRECSHAKPQAASSPRDLDRRTFIESRHPPENQSFTAIQPVSHD